MIRIKHHAPGTPPATLISHAEGEDRPSVTPGRMLQSQSRSGQATIAAIQYDSNTIFGSSSFEYLMQASTLQWLIG